MSQWYNIGSLTSWAYVCGHCGERQASDRGYFGSVPIPRRGDRQALIYICSHCQRPTYCCETERSPGVMGGESVQHLPDGVAAVYTEARTALAAGAPTAAVILCRTLISHVAVEKGATRGDTFQNHLRYLQDRGHLTSDQMQWIDIVRTTGGESAHDLVIADAAQAEGVLDWVSLLLKLVFEAPGRYAKLKAGQPKQP